MKLLPHQEEVKKKLQNRHGLILNWQVGSGKTIGAIAAAETTGNPSEVVVPASLRENFKKEVRAYKPKTKFQIESYESFTHAKPSVKGKTLIFDEAHRLRTSTSNRSQAAQKLTGEASKVLLLTGTPIQNAPHEIAPLVNIAAGKHMLPTSEKDFNAKYIQHEHWNPGILRYLGFKPVDEYHIKNVQDFRYRVKPYVDTYKEPNNPHAPVVHNVNVDVEMSPMQAGIYSALEKQLPSKLRRQIAEKLPVDPKEIGKLNSFLSATRQIANTSERFYKEDTKKYSPKLLNAAKIVRDSKGQSLIYSNYLEAGVHPMSELLTAIKVPHATFTGQLKDRERKKLVQDYNSGKIRALIVSSSGGEGLDLKNTRHVHILEPHWNEAKIDQVIGRSIRHGSHVALKPKDRTVSVYRYNSLLPKKVSGLFIKTENRPTSVDQYLKIMSDKKKKLNQEFMNQL
jgi:SNF2 family DNA or RNA helicase